MKLSNRTIKRLKNTYGNWALVTGASSGIGKEMALKLGESGYNLVVTGRSKQKLEDLATLIFNQYKVEVFPVSGDPSKEADVQMLIKETINLPLGIVVLNAGFGTSGEFYKSELESELNMLEINCRSILILTHHYCSCMIEEKRKGALVLLSSMIAFQGVPNAAHYAATKAYVQTLGEGLTKELKRKNVDILVAAPGPVDTGFAECAGMKMNMTLKPEQIGVPIIRSIGKRTTVFPGFLTKFLIFNLRLTPRWLRIRVMRQIMKGFTIG